MHIISTLIFIGLIILLFWTTKFDYASTLPWWGIGAIKILIIFACCIVLTLIFYILVIKRQKSDWKQNVGLIIYTILISFLLLEGVFIFVPQSQVAGTTLAYKRWMDYYWKPINQLGFRDHPIAVEQLSGKKIVMAVGDSFTAGHGIANIKDRYADVLATKLPENYRVLNLGRDGVDTSTELYRLFNFPIKPDILIFQYYGNDIEGVCVAETKKKEEERDKFFERYRDYPEIPTWAKGLVKNSYLLNFAYWQTLKKDEVSYFDFITPCFENRETLTKHMMMLQSLVNFSKQHSIPTVVVIFPLMLSIEQSKFYTQPLKDFFTKRGISVVDVGELSKDIPPKKRVIGKLDSHASVLVHQRIAEEINRMLIEKKIIGDTY